MTEMVTVIWGWVREPSFKFPTIGTIIGDNSGIDIGPTGVAGILTWYIIIPRSNNGTSPIRRDGDGPTELVTRIFVRVEELFLVMKPF
tara:strand:- start:126 stop:389 length:264 start_codon:yes stop_codon:yes gene_type:complete